MHQSLWITCHASLGKLNLCNMGLTIKLRHPAVASDDAILMPSASTPQNWPLAFGEKDACMEHEHQAM